MGFSTRECAWSHTTIKTLGKTIIGIRGFEFGIDVEDEYLYGAGNEPIDIQPGNNGYPGNLKLLKYELDQMNDAAIAGGFENVSKVPHDVNVITCVFKKNLSDPARTIVAAGVKFGSQKFAMEQNGKMTEVTLPFLSMKTVTK